MRALLYRNNTLTLSHNYPQPEPSEGEALIRVLLAGICNTDLEITRGYMGFEGVPGHEFVGIVEACILQGKSVPVFTRKGCQKDDKQKPFSLENCANCYAKSVPPPAIGNSVR